MNEIKTSEFLELQREIAALRGEVRAVHDGVLEAMPILKETIDKFLAAELHHIALDLERQFGSALALNPGSAVRQKESAELMRSSMESFQRQLSRGAEHVARLEDRVKSLERH